MYSDVSTLIGPATTIAAAGIGAYVGGRIGAKTERQKEINARRADAASTCLETLTRLRDLLQQDRSDVDEARWAPMITETYEVLDDAVNVMPGFRHLKRSLHQALGEALGPIVQLQLDPRTRRWPLAEHDPRWNRYAWEYTDLLIQDLRHWRDTTPKLAPTMTVPAYDTWLRDTGRHTPTPISTHHALPRASRRDTPS